MAGDGEIPFPSPEGKVKLLCSYGGKILPRPSDKLLRYVGGDTRLVLVPRSMSFSDLMKKMKSVFKAEVSIKYQLASEDLDSLVSVLCDEDVYHLLEEHDRQEARAWHARVRVFLFPVAGHLWRESRPDYRQLPVAPGLEQRYIEAVNGMVRAHSSPNLQDSEVNGSSAEKGATTGSARRRRPPPLRIAAGYNNSPAGTPRGDNGSTCSYRGHLVDPFNRRSPCPSPSSGRVAYNR